VGLFRRRESLHERLAREGGLSESEPVDTTPRWGEAGIHGVARPRQWDAVVTAQTEVAGERAAFVALPDGSLVIEDGPDDVQPLADALETELAPPYRAEAVRRGEGVWAVAGRRIDVVSFEHDGEQLQLTVHGDERALLVDGETGFGSVRELEDLAKGDAVVRAARIDGNDWEVRVDRL
jgi:uncharacterized protein (DUF2249 family)